MTASLIVIATSKATKQSRFPTLRVGKCVGGSQSRFENPKVCELCWRSQSLLGKQKRDCRGFPKGSHGKDKKENPFLF
jgi:hypothetical protein